MALTWRVPVLMLLGIVAVAVFPRGLTVVLWLAALVGLVVVDVLLAPSLSRLSVVRRASASTRQGQPAETVLEIDNTGRRRIHGVLRDAWQPSAGAVGNRHRLDLVGGGETELSTVLVPTRRGDRRADRVTARSIGPLGLAARQSALKIPGTVRVLPPFHSRKHLPSRLARLRELDGRSAVRVRGLGTEFDSLREYVRGDDVRSIDWRASARNKNVVVRTWQPERDRRVVLVLDTGRTSAGRVGDIPRLDSAMDAALLLAALAARAGDRIDFVAGDRGVRSRIKGSHGGDVLGKLLDTMSQLEPVLAETNWQRLVGAVDGLGRHRALVVLLTPLEPSAVEQGLLPLIGPLTSRHRVIVASVRDPALHEIAGARGDAASAYHAAAAEQAIARRDATARLLGALGVEVLDADADRLAVVLADHYLALKARGLL
ncbi:MAG: DUF58 domain-containing protein [Actinomycetota bacterium]|nr:DUF58 domain-containing protein [Actinomycetota bacterium]